MTSRLERSLRACVVHGGQVLEERRLEAGQALSIGTGPKNTFVIADPALPESHMLFVNSGGRYELILADNMRARLSTDQSPEPIDLAMLRQQGLLKRRGTSFV